MLFLDPSQYLKGLPLDYRINFDRVSSYFDKDYRKIKLEKRKISDDVMSKIESYSKEIEAPSAVFENIEALKEAPIVCTGQQPCLLTGPLFVIYKAATAVILADKLKAVPVFWNASEDDDVSEVNHIWVLNSQVQKISLELESRPFSKIVLKKEDIQYVINQLEALTPPTEFRSEILGIVRKCSQSFSEAFSRTLTTLFSDHGLIVVEPKIFGDAVIPVYQKFIEYPTEATQLVNEAGASLETQGYKRQMHKTENSCSFYLLFEDKRHTVVYDEGFHAHGETFTKRELLELLDEHPECFSSTVVSRPLVQDFLFSTLAYCAGPGEISYFAQMKEVYTFFKVAMPYIIPRYGATFMEKKVQKVLDKYSLDMIDLETPDRILKTLARADISEFFSNRRGEVMKPLQRIEEYIQSVDVNLEKASKASSARILKELAALEEKAASSVKKQNSLAEAQISKASANVFPNRMLQERVLNIFQYLIRYRSLIEDVCQHFRNAPLGEHAIIHLGD